MAIYKPPKARWPLAVFAGVIGLLIGLAVGFVLGREDPDPAEGARIVQRELTGAAAALDVVGIEYAESVENGEVTNETEYQGALDALASSRDRFESVSAALAVLAPERVDALASAYDDVAAAMEDRADGDEVDGLLDELAEMLKEGGG